jgi:hypothetical protein
MPKFIMGLKETRGRFPSPRIGDKVSFKERFAEDAAGKERNG